MTLCALPSSAVLQSGTCVSPFTSLAVVSPIPTLPPLPTITVCALDIDGDGIGDLQVPAQRGVGVGCPIVWGNGVAALV